MAVATSPNPFSLKLVATTGEGLLPALAPSPLFTWFPAPTLVVSDNESRVSESLLLAGVRMPGQWLLTDSARIFGWEERKGFALTGATLIPTGDPLVRAKFDIKIWNNLDAWAYRQLLKTVLKKPALAISGAGTFVVAGTQQIYGGLEVVQPQLNDVGVTSVVLGMVTPLMNPLVSSGGKGPWTAKVELIQFRSPIAAIKTPVTTYPKENAPGANELVSLEQQKADQAHAAAAAAYAQALTGGPKP